VTFDCIKPEANPIENFTLITVGHGVVSQGALSIKQLDNVTLRATAT